MRPIGWVVLAVLGGTALAVFGAIGPWSAPEPPSPPPPAPPAPVRAEGSPPGFLSRGAFENQAITPATGRQIRDGMRVPGGAGATLKGQQQLQGAETAFSADEAGLDAALTARRAEVASCWRAAVAHDPSLAAQRALRVTLAAVGPGARVTAVDSGAEMLDRCLLGALGDLPFRSTTETTLTRTLTLP